MALGPGDFFILPRPKASSRGRRADFDMYAQNRRNPEYLRGGGWAFGGRGRIKLKIRGVLSRMCFAKEEAGKDSVSSYPIRPRHQQAGRNRCCHLVCRLQRCSIPALSQSEYIQCSETSAKKKNRKRRTYLPCSQSQSALMMKLSNKLNHVSLAYVWGKKKNNKKSGLRTALNHR